MCELDSPAKIAKSALFLPLVRLTRALGQPARGLERAEPPGRCPDLHLEIVRAGESDT
jgi:hypothetical protein